MTRPRRPIVAAACAALLLATVTLWVATGFIEFRINMALPSAYTSVTVGRGGVREVRLSTSDRPRDGRVSTFADRTTPLMGSIVAAFFPMPTYTRGGAVQLACLPYWLVAMFSTLCLWRSCRQRPPGKGFPVDPVTEPA